MELSWAVLLPMLLSGGSVQAECIKPDNNTKERDNSGPACNEGLVLPMWLPQENLSTGDRVARGIVYFIAMIYLFIGVSIVSDRFMAAIEVITSKEKEITVKRPNGETQIVVVRVWNETVANLTLMALGSSAPEILLSIIEIWAKNFEAGDLGPGTIVGSAAFNLLIIIALCVYVIPSDEVRKIKHLRVFFVTATWSIFAYVWLYVILAVISPCVVDVWEGILTFLFFPATVLTAYVADRRMLIYKYLSKQYRMNRRGVIVETEGDMEMANKINHVDGGLKTLEEEEGNEEIREFEQNRREYIQMLRDLRKKYPNMDMEELETMAREEVMNKGPKSRAFYRIQATRKLTGGGNIMKKIQERTQSDLAEIRAEHVAVAKEDEMVCKVFFDPGHYTVMENVGQFVVTVAREGGDPNQSLLVDYHTEDGTASGGSDYLEAKGTLFFPPMERHKTITLEVIDDDVFEEDEHFYVRLTNLRLATPDGTAITHPVNGEPGIMSNKPTYDLSSPFLATVMILDDDHGGIFSFPEKDIELVESVGTYELKVVRWSGARGKVAIPYYTDEGTAKPGKEYEHSAGELIFENNESEAFISIHIIEEDSYEKDVLFYVQLGEPKQLSEAMQELERKPPSELTEDEKIALLGRPKLGPQSRAQIRIKESKEFKNTVDKLVQRANASLLIGTSSWKEQFIEAITVSADDDEGGEGDEEKMPSCGDYVMHFVTLFWKILFAFVPPTDILDGYVSFVVSILSIGMLTAIIGDLASHLGCTIGLKDTVTAIAFVALGTSVPDTFASKVAAVQDKYADASVGNVTGSNAVNVFLGIGIAWSIAAIYHAVNGRPFIVQPGSLAFSVTIFCSIGLVAIFVLLLRRSKRVGGELGGPVKYKLATSILFVCLWFFYVIMSSLEAYKVIEGF